MTKIINRRAVLFVTVALMLGIFIGGLVIDNLILTIVLPIAFFAVGLIFLLGWKKVLICAVYFALAAGTALYAADFHIGFDGEVNKNCSVTARVEKRSGKYFIVEDLLIDGEKYKGKARVITEENLATGDIISFECTAKTLTRDIFDNYDNAAYSDRIYYELSPTAFLTAERGELKFFEKVKARITAPVYRYMEAEDAGIAVSLLFGDKSGLTEYDGEIIRGIGMSHVFAVSGLHVGFLTALIIFILKKLKIGPKASLVAVCVALIFYGFLTGFPAGIKRAAIMTVIYFIAPLTRRKADPVTTLSAACFIILFTNPRELFDLGFIMSVSAVLGIILFYKPIYSGLLRNKTNKILKYSVGGIATTLSANILLLPIFFNVFNSVALYSVAANLIILPLVTVAYTMLSVASLFTAAIPPLGFLYFPAQYPLVLIRLLSGVVYSLPFAEISVSAMGAVSAAYLGACLFACPLNKSTYKTKLVATAVFAAAGILLLSVPAVITA